MDPHTHLREQPIQAPRFTVSSYVSNHGRMGGQMWYRVIDTTTGKTVEKGFRDSKFATDYAAKKNADVAR